MSNDLGNLDPKILAKARRNARKKRQRDMIDVRGPTTPGKLDAPIPPTAEQRQHADYVEAPVYDVLPGGVRTIRGRAFQRVAKFESIEGLDAETLRALRHYRRVFDRSEVSEVKSALDIRPRGSGGDGALARLESTAFIRWELLEIEKRVPSALLPTLRSVALHDVDFKQIAIDTYGGREVEHIDVSGKKPMSHISIQPRSGRHRAIVREDFLAAARSLTKALRPTFEAEAKARAGEITNTPPTSTTAAIDPAFLDEQGRMRSMDEIAAIILNRFYDAVNDTDRFEGHHGS